MNLKGGKKELLRWKPKGGGGEEEYRSLYIIICYHYHNGNIQCLWMNEQDSKKINMIQYYKRYICNVACTTMNTKYKKILISYIWI